MVQLKEVPADTKGLDGDNETSQTAPAANSASAVKSRAERKARQILNEWKPERVENFSRLAIRRKTQILAIDAPEAYKIPGTNTYIFFGTLKDESPRNNPAMMGGAAPAQAQGAQGSGAPEILKNAAAKQFANVGDSADSNNDPNDKGSIDVNSLLSEAKTSRQVIDEAEGDDDEDLGDVKFEEKDLEMVMSQTGVDRQKAIRALKKNNGDIVNAIMELS